jgi:dTDP-glucose 4,6-dehydratase
MKNLLVTGGAGFIGSNFIYYLIRHETGVKVVNLDALTYAGRLANLKDVQEDASYAFIHGDIRDQDLVGRVISQENIDTIVHFAAESHVDRSILGPDAFVQTNILGTFSLLEAVRKGWNKPYDAAQVRFHHVSTDEVFGALKPGEAAWTEETPYAPNSPYAASKAASDHLVRAYGHTYGLPCTITNCSNNYGPRQFPEKLLPLMILNAVQGKSLPVYGDGGQIRDWLFVEDHCEAIHSVLRKGRPGETYNIGGGNQPTNLEVVKSLCQVLDRLLPDSPYRPHAHLIQFVADRPGHDRRYDMDSTKIRRELGWEPRTVLADGLEMTTCWYLDNADWVRDIGDQDAYREWLQKNYKERK